MSRHRTAALALALLGALVLTAAEAGLRHHYLSRTYRYYPATEVYWEDQNTLLLYLPHRLYFWSLRPGVAVNVEERITPFGPEGAGEPHLLQWTIQVNGRGFRGPEIPSSTDSRYRVLCLGDSRTLGEGLPDGETWPRKLERLLRSSDIPEAVVINAGADGWTSHQGLALLREEGPALRPDAVAIAFGVNDGDRAWGVTDRERARLTDTAYTSIQRSLYRSFLFYALQSAYLKARVALIGGQPALRRLSQEGPPRVPLPHYEENLREMVRAARRLGARPILLSLPLNRHFDWSPWRLPNESETTFDHYAKVVVAISEQEQADLVTLPAETADAFLDDMHLSPSGSARLARALESTLRVGPP